MGKSKILVIDDELSISNVISSYLKAENFDYRVVNDGIAGYSKFISFQPDIIILDIMLPGMDGIELLTKIRKESNVYIIMLTAKTEEIDKIIGLSVGADDYMTKPFSPRELIARIKAALRRLNQQGVHASSGKKEFQNFSIDVNRRQVWVKDREIELTATEFDLLNTLVEHYGMVLSREQIIENVWGHDYFGEIRVVDVHLGNVRKKIGAGHGIKTVRGVGFQFLIDGED